jgi:hypothetical protein
MSELSAGRELDALVAEKVMGYPGAAVGGWSNPHVTPLPYSTDIDAAWSVVEHMARDGFAFSLWRSDGNGSRSLAGFNCPLGPCEKHGNPYDNWHGSRDIRADTVPLAICRAALEAVA